MVGWSRPYGSQLKINVKGVFSREYPGCGVGVIIRDTEGHWVHGACGVIGLTLPVGVELWSIYHGLKLAWSKGKKNIVLECESAQALECINHPDPDYHLSNLVECINNLRYEDWDECEIVHIDSSANAAAVALANHGRTGVHGCVKELTSPPSAIQSIIEAESRGV